MPVNIVSADRVYTDDGFRRTAPTYNRHQKGRFIGPSGWRCKATQRSARMHLIDAHKAVAVDCEGVILENEVGINKKGLGRISIVNEPGQVIYDTFVHYPKDVPHRPPPQRLNLGVKYQDIRPENGAQPIAEVLRVTKQIFDGAKLIVGHAISNDKHMLRGLPWDDYDLHDTQQVSEYRGYATGYNGDVGLSTLASLLLGRTIQQHGHSSVDDARATMELYLLHKSAVDQQQDQAVNLQPAVIGLSANELSAKDRSLINIISSSEPVVAELATPPTDIVSPATGGTTEESQAEQSERSEQSASPNKRRRNRKTAQSTGKGIYGREVPGANF